MQALLMSIKQGARGASASGLMSIIGSVILVVVALILAPVVMDSIAEVTGHGDIETFPGTAALANLIPLVYVVGVLGLAGFMAWRGLRG